MLPCTIYMLLPFLHCKKLNGLLSELPIVRGAKTEQQKQATKAIKDSPEKIHHMQLGGSCVRHPDKSCVTQLSIANCLKIGYSGEAPRQIGILDLVVVLSYER